MQKPIPRPVQAPAVLGMAALIAIVPMLLHGPSCGHDFDFHLLSWLEAANQFAHFGYPHWAFTPAWNAGEPRFIFYPPLSWTLGALLGLVLPWTLVPAAFTWMALTLSGLTMFRLARRYAGQNAALLAATLYLANPYMLFTAYERTAYGELLAAAWLPLLFAAALPSKDLSSSQDLSSFAKGGGPASRLSASRLHPILRIALPLALLWLTNAPAAVMGSYTLAFLTVLRLCMRARHSERSEEPLYFAPATKLRLAVTTLAGTALGLALTAFYLIPAAYEQRFVQVNMAVIPGMRPSEHFLFHRMGGHTFDDLFHDQVVRTASLVALTLLFAIAIALLFSLKPASNASVPHPSPHSGDGWEPRVPDPRFPLTLLTLLIAFLLTPPSLFLWNHIPKLAFLQFPWRLTALLGVIFATLAARALSRWKIPSFLLPFPCLLLVLVCWRFFAQRCDFEDTVPARVALFHSHLGTEPTDEYTPKVDDNDALGQANPPYWLVSPTPPSAATPGQAPAHLVLDLPQPEILILNRRAFPSWTVTLDGKPQPQLQARHDGLIALPLPAGPSTVDILYHRTADQTAGLALSALAALATLTLTRRSKPR